MLPAVAGLAALLAIAAGVITFLVVSRSSPANTGAEAGQVTLEYATQRGQPATQGVVDSPLRITLRLPYNGIEDSVMINAASVQLFDEEGKPAEYGGVAPEPFRMEATYELGVWAHDTSVPSKQGK